jgi:hypothetical protein
LIPARQRTVPEDLYSDDHTECGHRTRATQVVVAPGRRRTAPSSHRALVALGPRRTGPSSHRAVVAPAKAGAQLIREQIGSLWIPAFAGMTTTCGFRRNDDYLRLSPE